ncbi:MAG: GtrA family protein [Terriglobales bacterium]
MNERVEARGRVADGTDGKVPALRLEGLVRWLKFNFVGGIGIFVQLAALTLFRAGLHLDYLLATGLAVETAVIHNFLWHERFTWRDRPSAHIRQSLVRFAKFNATNGAVSIVGNLLIMRALVGGLQMNYVAANLIAVAVCSLVNFVLSNWLVFPDLQTEADSSLRPE